MRKPLRIALILTLIAIAIGGARVASCEYRSRRLDSAYETLQPGDSHQRVIGLMGDAKDVEPCGDARSEDEFKRKCRVSLLYYSFLERWIIYLDAEDRVISKVNNEGFY